MEYNTRHEVVSLPECLPSLSTVVSHAAAFKVYIMRVLHLDFFCKWNICTLQCQHSVLDTRNAATILSPSHKR